MNKTVVLIHGMFQNPKSWENWISFFESKGYNVIAPAWPFHEGEPSQLRNSPPAGLGELELDTIITEIETLILGLPEKPIVIGHSVGGLIAQILVKREIAKLAVAICSVAPNAMVTFDWSFFKNAATIANPFKGNEPIEMDLETFKGAFANTLSDAEVEIAFETTATHDSRNVFRDCMGSTAQINTDLPHAPMLFIAAEEDKICPADLIGKIHKAYTDENSVTQLKEFPRKSHFICNEPGWEEVLGYIENWLQQQPELDSEEANPFYTQIQR